MKKRLLALVAPLLLVSACKSSGVSTGTGGNTPCVVDLQTAMDDYYAKITDQDPNNDPVDTPRECDLPAQTAGPELTSNVTLIDFNAQQEEKMLESIKRALVVLNSDEFKQRVLDFTWNGQKQFNDNNGQTNEEIYETLMNASETLVPGIDHEIDLNIVLYYSMTSTVGYTYPDQNKIWVNSKFFNGYNYGQVAANAIHEWTHKLGYGHDYYSNSDRPYSVPYGIGGIINEMVNDL